MRHTVLVIALAMATGAAAQEGAQRDALVIYNAASSNTDALFEGGEEEGSPPGGYAIVYDRRQFELKNGTNTIEVRDVPRWLDPGAVSLRAVGDNANVEILDQRFQHDALSFDALVQRHLGHAVEILSGAGTANATITTGTLIANAGGLTVQQSDGRVATVTDYSRVTFPDLPKGLSAAAALRWSVASKKAGPQVFELVYPTQGLGWRAEYSAWIAPGADCKLDFAAWAEIANQSGSEFRNVELKLVAGEPHRVTQAVRPRPMMAAKALTRGAVAEESGNVGDYHEYTVGVPVDLAIGSLVRVALYPSQTVACQRQYVYESSRLRANPGMAPITERSYGGDERWPVTSTLGLRIDRPLPAGRIRVLENAADGTPEFVGEDQIGHTPRNEPVTLTLGEAFDLRGERSQTDFQVDKDHRTMSESFAIRLADHGARPQTVVVREHLYRWTQWNIVQSSTKYEKRSADTVEFKVDVPANGEAKLTYTVQYQWSESLK